MPHSLHVVTHNIHKGFSQFNTRMMIHELREQLRLLNPDIVFLQEVLGNHQRHARRHANWPSQPQHEFLAEEIWKGTAYGRNAVYTEGHHGNAILSRFPIVSITNYDVTRYRFERRGLLHCEIELPEDEELLHCICVHLSLYTNGRYQQLLSLSETIQKLVPEDAPLIIAGDFNDWRNQAGQILGETLGLREVFHHVEGKHARSFPSLFPLLPLDRIYVRGFDIMRVEVLVKGHWPKISDHAALSAHLVRV